MMRIGSLVFGKTDIMKKSPEEVPKMVFRRRAEEMAFNERGHSKSLVGSYCYARILIEGHLRVALHDDMTQRLRMMRPGLQVTRGLRRSSHPRRLQCSAASYLRPTINHEFAPRTSI